MKQTVCNHSIDKSRYKPYIYTHEHMDWDYGQVRYDSRFRDHIIFGKHNSIKLNKDNSLSDRRKKFLSLNISYISCILFLFGFSYY